MGAAQAKGDLDKAKEHCDWILKQYEPAFETKSPLPEKPNFQSAEGFLQSTRLNQLVYGGLV